MKALSAEARYGLKFKWDERIVSPQNKLAYIKAREKFLDLICRREEWERVLDADRLRMQQEFAKVNPKLRLDYAAELPVDETTH